MPLLVVCGWGITPVDRATASWSAPQVLGRACSLIGAPQVAFPSEAPTLPTGQGAIVWAQEPALCGGSPPGVPPSFNLMVAPIGASERPAAASSVTVPGAFTGELAAVGADFGQVAIAAGARGEGVAGDSAAEVLQGRAGRLPGGLEMVGRGLPLVVTRGYLGDVAVASLRSGEIDVWVERWDRRGFRPARVVPVGAGPVTAIALTMDYRSDLLLVWQQSGSIFARVLRGRGSDDPTQRLAPCPPYPQLEALISDNNHGMVAWSSTVEGKGAGSGPVTKTYIEMSGVGVRFGGTPGLVASFGDPAQVGRSEGSLELVRLADENVEMGWTTVEDGRYVVRAAPAVYATSGSTTLISNPAEDAILADLAAGPDDEAIALWTNRPRLQGAASEARARVGARARVSASGQWDSTSGPDEGSATVASELWDASTTIVPRDHVVSEPPEMIAPESPIVSPTVAVDPANDDAVAAWSLAGVGASVEYSVSPGAEGYRPHPPSAARRTPLTPGQWMGIAFAAGASAAEQALAAMES